MKISELQKEVQQLLRQKGFSYSPDTFWEKIALLHTEVSELADVVKKKGFGAKKEIAEEIADIFIRAMNFGLMFDIDVEQAIRDKMAYNFTRPYQYGIYKEWLYKE